MGDIIVRSLNKSDPITLFGQVADLHMREIHHGLLPQLGRKFVAFLYRELSAQPETVIWAAFENDQLLGFICGCSNLWALYGKLLKRPVVWQNLLLSGALFSPQILKKILSLVIYPFRKPSQTRMATQVEIGHAELLAISVSPLARGKGIGRILVKNLEKSFESWNVRQPYRVTTNQAEVASNKFYSALGFKPLGTIPHHDLTLKVYYKELS